MPLTLDPDVDDVTTLIHIHNHGCDDPLSPPHTDETGSLSSLLTAEYASIGDLIVPTIADTLGGGLQTFLGAPYRQDFPSEVTSMSLNNSPFAAKIGTKPALLRRFESGARRLHPKTIIVFS
jgi:hypothetical protein